MVRYDTDSEVLWIIQAAVNTEIAIKWIINTQSHSDFAPNI